MTTATKNLPALREVPVIWAERPFADVQVRRVACGATVAEIVASQPDLPQGFDAIGIVAIDGVEVPREFWHLVRPRPDHRNAGRPIVVQLGIRLSGGGSGGGGKSTLRTVAVVALLVAAVAIGQFEALGAFGATTAFGSVTTANLMSAGAATGRICLGAIVPPGSVS
jgi:hypothetical protein